MRLWLGVELSPSVVATATALLPMGGVPAYGEDDLYAAHRRVENARHAPATLGDTQPSATRTPSSPASPLPQTVQSGTASTASSRSTWTATERPTPQT